MQVAQLAKYLNDEEAATDLLEEMRWAGGRFCPSCGCTETYRLNVKKIKRRRYKCRGCQKQFTVSVGTVMEDSHIPFGKWIYAIYQMCIAKKGVSAKQLQRELGLGYRAAWFMCHRIRYAMTQAPLAGMLSGIVEMDETYVGGKQRGRNNVGRDNKTKTAVLSLVERDGRAKSFVVPDVKGPTLKELAYDNIEITADVMTDRFVSYKGLQGHFASHQAVDHSKEFARGIVHVNFAESYFSLLKRGIIGTFHHISSDHLQRYLGEFDFRWNHRKADTGVAFANVVRGSVGKRLRYRNVNASIYVNIGDGI
jgi:transposase-like protein